MKEEMKNYSTRINFDNGNFVKYNFKAISNNDANLFVADRIFAEAVELEKGVKIKSVRLYKIFFC